ncbi:lysophospholipase L1-like esterase [Arcicella aurantiaca]|uniref:Lysophospholipase L1-like esterase n=1 Tax=Arcicella aurantiaca TaxID=591202 RepID=A0A316DJM1_9BACT|nr:rhamnogalacturonan acetylesterase [Arcicella aurantiaca]PWK18125.1 lysophospholipase L1-like esterase [Arcicella aurantiaca]
MKKLIFLIVLMSQLTFAQVPQKFNFEALSKKGFVTISPELIYTPVQAYGYVKGTNNRYFTFDISEGNYDVIMQFGSNTTESETTIKVENRRLVLEKIQVAKGETVTKTFTVNIRNAKIDETRSVELKPRESSYLHWDNQLTFEFCGKNPAVRSIEIRPNKKAITVFLAGNSTVVDQIQEPFTAWGQMIPRFFNPQKIAIANHAESGESLKSFVSENRLEKILSQMKKGDYLFVEFAHNDQKIKDFRPFIEYRNLLKDFIERTRQKGGNPVLVTSMHRRNFDENGKIINTLGDFPEAMRLTAQEYSVPLIDLNAISKILWESMGVEESKKAFVHVSANTYPNQDKAIADNTHFSNYGAYQLAKCIVEEIKKIQLPISKYLVETQPFDPHFPDNLQTWDFPASPAIPVVKPDGN